MNFLYKATPKKSGLIALFVTSLVACSSSQLTGTSAKQPLDAAAADAGGAGKSGSGANGGSGNDTIPVGEHHALPIPAGVTPKSCESADPQVAKVDAKTCLVVGMAVGKTQVKVIGTDGSSHTVDVTVTPKGGVTSGGGSGGGTGTNGDPGTLGNGGDPSTGDGKPELTTSGGGTTINVTVTRLHIDAVIDHDSTLKVTPTSVYWQHHAPGAPEKTTVSFYDANGKLINETPWEPKFTPGHGTNCPASVFGPSGLPYCKAACDCVSDEVKLAVPAKLTGTVSNITNQGSGKNRDDSETGGVTATPGAEVDVHLLDCGKDCGRNVDYTLPGLGRYTFDLQ